MMRRRYFFLNALALFASNSVVSMGRAGDAIESQKIEMEIHFQEGFFGQNVRIDIGNESLIEVTAATTKLMIGLAEIVKLNVADGQKIIISVEGEPESGQTFFAQSDRPFVVVSRTESGLTLDFPEKTPGYL